MVVAPATANTLAKMANGIADNLLTSIYLAFAKTVVVAPAMNTNMWEHPATAAQRGAAARATACSWWSRGRASWPAASTAPAAWPTRTASWLR